LARLTLLANCWLSFLMLLNAALLTQLHSLHSLPTADPSHFGTRSALLRDVGARIDEQSLATSGGEI
jgi:hypothetical protein